MCALLVAVWVGSRWWQPAWVRDGTIVAFINGQAFISIDHSNTPRESSFLWLPHSNSAPFQWWFGQSHDGHRTFIWIPLWLPVAVALGLNTALWRLDSLARRRARLNHCPTCNYDRTGIPTAIPCPECGAPPVAHPCRLKP
jgi:hypothetical protein